MSDARVERHDKQYWKHLKHSKRKHKNGSNRINNNIDHHHNDHPTMPTSALLPAAAVCSNSTNNVKQRWQQYRTRAR